MLRIRPEQMEALGNYMRKQFEARMLKHLRSQFPERTANVTDEKIAAVVKQGIAKADEYGVEYEDEIQQFLEYLVIYGPNMDMHPRTQWIGDILRCEHLSGTAKMELIDQTELATKQRHPYGMAPLPA